MKNDLEAAKNILYGIIGDGLEWVEQQRDIEMAIKDIEYVIRKYQLE